MNDMNKRKRIAIILTISAIVMTIIGGTFAYWSWQTDQTEQTAVTFTVAPTFSCSADGGGNITSNEKMLIPTSCTNANYAIKRTVKVNTTISDNNPVYLNMWLKINEIGTGLANSENFMYALTTSDQGCDQGTVIATGTFQGGAEDDTFKLLEDKEYLTTTTNDTYYLYIWLDTAESNSATQDQTFDMELGGECTNQTPKSIIYTIKENAVMDNIASTYVTNANGIQFDNASSNSNGKGLYIRSGTENDLYPIYYYRGAVTDNNVLFGGFCWHIVRTTSTGGTKLIYNGIPADGQCYSGRSPGITSSSFNSSSDGDLSSFGYMYGTRYTYSFATGTGWYYAPDVTYGNGTYTLVSKGSYNVETKSDISGTNINYQHYTCGSTDITCTNVRYVYGVYGVSSNKALYITLSNGKKVEDALDEMLTNSTNIIDSDVKNSIDTWYASNLTDYLIYLEDTPWCNDREIYQLGSWNPDGGSISSDLLTTSYQRSYETHNPSLSCRKNDSFTVNSNNGNGKLTYPIGLPTVDEFMLAGLTFGKSSDSYIYVGRWGTKTMSPAKFRGNLDYNGSIIIKNEFSSLSFGNIGGAGSATYLTRPMVSLKPGIKFISGDGTTKNPYVVEAAPAEVAD